jgi:hypothetical protein
LEYPTPPEHVHADHIEHAWEQASDRIATRLDSKGD